MLQNIQTGGGFESRKWRTGGGRGGDQSPANHCLTAFGSILVLPKLRNIKHGCVITALSP